MPAPTITAGTAALLAAAAAASGIGSGIAASTAADAQKDAALETAKGPVRGGTERAGNLGEKGFDLGVLEKIGQTAVPMRAPVYGNAGAGAMPVDTNKLFQPKQFGAGFQAGNYNLPNVTRRF